MQEIFDRRNPLWKRVSTKYAYVEMIGYAVAVAILIGVAVFFWRDGELRVIAFMLAALAVIFIVAGLLSFRRVRAIGYVLLEDELVFRRGIMFERIVAVPYGRLQLVDITRGPLLRALGLASLKFVTAAQSTGVVLPGLTLGEAEALRDDLMHLAESRRSGL